MRLTGKNASAERKPGGCERTPWLPPRWFIVLAWKVQRALIRATGGHRGLWPARAQRWGAMRLTAIGRRSGQERPVILGYLQDGPNLVTLAMNGWGEGEPAWWLNLQAHPQARVQLTDGTRQIVAHAATGMERARLWDRWRAVDKNLDGFARRRSTQTAVVVLEPDDNDKPMPVSISEKIHVNINGSSKGLDEYFTVAWWEQRGSGLSYRSDIPPESVNPDQLVSDTLSLTDYLRTRFGQQKIYLMGHSGGTFIGIQAAARAPECYRAYVGVAQMSNQLESEKLAYAYMLQRFKDDGNTKMVRRLREAPVTDSVPLPDSYLSVRDVAMHSLGIGTTHDMKSVVTGLLLRSFENRDYTLGEKIRMWRGKIFSGSRLWNTQLSTDLTKKVTRLDVPAYFLHGVYDYTVSYPLAKSYYEQLDAPLKGFYTFTKSAHSPLFEEPQRMREIMQADVLAGENGLADPQ